LIDPEIIIRPTKGQVDDLISEIRSRVMLGERILVTTLTKRMAEDLSEYLMEVGIKVHYLHSEVDTLDRIGILRDLRMGVFDVIVGINLLREGLDLPEVSLVAILDADKEGFLRSATALIQTVGRAARHLHGQVIMYADKLTQAMQQAIQETNRRREKQIAYNEEHHITPVSISKAVHDLTERISSEHAVAEKGSGYSAGRGDERIPVAELKRIVKELEQQMKTAAKNLEFERAAVLRDEIIELRALIADESQVAPWKKAQILSGEIE